MIMPTIASGKKMMPVVFVASMSGIRARCSAVLRMGETACRLDGEPVAGRLPREVVDQDHPPHLPPARRGVTYSRSVHIIPITAPTGTRA